MAFGKKTKSGQEAKKKHQEQYASWWLGLDIESGAVYNGIPAKGTVVSVEYIGDSFQGCVRVVLSNRCEAFVTGEGYRPTKEDINRI